jgi:hypothetical protein
MLFHIYGGKRCAPAQNGTQAVFQAHVRVKEFFFFMDQHHQTDEPVEAAADEKDECEPGERATHKIVYGVHAIPSLS